MSSPSRVGRLAAAAAVALPWLLAAAHGAELRFVQRLHMPAAVDAIGYGQAVTADPHTGEVFVCDSYRNRIVIFDDAGIYRYQIQGGSVFSAPQDVAVDPEGYLLVAAYRGGRPAVFELDFDGAFRREITWSGLPEGLEPPAVSSLALSPTGDRVYFVDERNLRLWITDRSGAIVGSVDLSQPADDRRPRERTLGRVDVSGDVVSVTLSGEGQVRLFGLQGAPRVSFGEQGTAACQLGEPVAAALLADGTVAIVDHQRMKVLHWNPAGNRCLGDYLGIGNAPGAVYYPRDLAAGPSGRLYVSQGFEGRVQVYEGLPPVAPSKGIAAAIE